MSSLVDDRTTLVTGASGQVGTAFREVLPDATFLTRLELDLGDTTSIPGVLESYRPSAVINCAAYTDVDRAENEEEHATIINGEAVGILVQACADLAIPFVTFSTDYVFDGRATVPYLESDSVNPVGAYGRSKLLGEQLALERHSDTLVVRTSWVISGTHDNFVSTMLRLARRGRRFKVVDDQYGRPTIAGDVAAATLAALTDGLRGIVHLANMGETTWRGLATAAVQLAGLDPSLVEPCMTEEYPTAAVRPLYSVLGTERTDAPVLPHWRDSLSPLVAEQVKRTRGS